MKKQIKAKAPAKIILSGEHAVVYGKPALALAVNRFASVSIESNNSTDIKIVLPDLHYHQQTDLTQIAAQKQLIDSRYQNFLDDKCAIYDVIFNDHELVQYVLGYFFNEIIANSIAAIAQVGFDVNIASNIPIGCGMGSSAAMIISLLQALSEFFSVALTCEQKLKFGREIEKIQHGKSSGLDICVATCGGCIYFCKGNMCNMPIPHKHNFCLVNTGRSVSTTGECVKAAAGCFVEDNLGDKFAVVAKSLSRALYNDDWVLFKKAIHDNNKLLQEIGVVPTKVQHFISDIERYGGAAKISGAGSIFGDNAGVVLVVNATEYINDLVAAYGYTIIPITIEERGVRTL